jgi:hypothetical protein
MLTAIVGESKALADNDETYFLSPAASLVGGAVEAYSEDAGAIWYNPAGLAHVERNQLDLSMNAVTYQRRVVDRGVEVLLPPLVAGDPPRRADYSPPLTDLDVRTPAQRAGGASPRYVVDRTHLVNLRAGGYYAISDIFAVGGGVFTDWSPERRPRDLGDFRVHFYGLTAGIRTDTKVNLHNERVDTLIFRTTISARYAYGKGTTPVLGYDQSTPTLVFDAATGELRNVRFHEVYICLGSSLLF